MSFSGSGITFSGLASGIDSDSIIARILQLEQRPITSLQIQQAELRNRLGATEQYKSLIQALRTAAKGLNTADAFNPIKASSSDSEVATVSASSSALPGLYNLAVSKLAQAHKLGTAAQTDSTSALNLSGAFLINGKAVDIAATDSLSAIATKVNSLETGVIASIINGGAGNVYLSLTAKNSGADNEIALSDVASGTVLQSLGFVAGAAAIRKPITNGAESLGFSDSVTTIGTLLGISVPSGNVQINGINVNLNFATQSLADIASAINSAGTGATATVVSAEEAGETVYKLQITGASTPTFTDANNMLQSLGILQRGAGNELLEAQDAEYTLDGISLQSASNAIADVIPGATITLLKADEAAPETTTLTLTRDTEAIRTKVGDLVKAYNDVLDFLEQAADFDSESLVSGPLFGDSTVSQVQDMVFRGLLQSPPGITGDYANLLAIGIDFDSKGRMSLDNAKFDAAVAADLDNVKALFTEIGAIDDADVRFISAGPKTKPSGLVGYEVIISQLATFGAHTAGTAFTGTSSVEETLTFNGNLFGGSEYALTIDPGSTIDSLVTQINSDAKLKELMTASKDVNNKLVLTSKRYGTPGNFTLKSSLAAASDNSGIGDSEVVVVGLDVMGTINGETATGSGQYLTGNAGNANTDGLQIRVTGGALGSRGTLIYSKGSATVLEDALDSALDFVSGFITSGTQAIQGQIDDIDDRIEVLREGISRKQDLLRRQFAAMEEAVSRLQAQTAQLGSLLNGLNNLNQNR